MVLGIWSGLLWFLHCFPRKVEPHTHVIGGWWFLEWSQYQQMAFSQYCDGNKMVNSSFSESPVIDFVHTMFHIDSLMLLSVSTVVTCAFLIHAIKKTDSSTSGSLGRDRKRCYGDGVVFIQSSESPYVWSDPTVFSSFSSAIDLSSTVVLPAQNDTEWDSFVIRLGLLLSFLFSSIFLRFLFFKGKTVRIFCG